MRAGLLSKILALMPVLVLALPLPGAAQTFGLPQGCEAYVTVQKRNCTVTHLFRCPGDPEGHQRRVDVDEGGMTYAGLIDAETQWIESWHVLADSVDRLMAGASDPASFSTLLAEGVDSFAFSTMTDDTYRTDFEGEDRLTGETVVVDGVTLEQTAFRVVARDPQGNVLWQTEGNEYIHRDWRTFLSGTRTTTNSTETWEDDGTPVEFAFPGEEGFLSSVPRHGCGVMLSRAMVGAIDLTQGN